MANSLKTRPGDFKSTERGAKAYLDRTSQRVATSGIRGL